MKNKKLLTLKTLCLISTTAVLSTGLVSTTIIINNQNNNAIINNNALTNINLNDSTGSFLLTSATNIFEGGTINGDLKYTNTSTPLPNEVFIEGYDSTTNVFSAENVKFKDSLTFDSITNCSRISVNTSAFAGCENLSGSLTFSIANVDIKSYAFSSCINLESVDFSSATQLTTISESAFEGCTSLSTITFSTTQGLETISANAFKNTAITSVSIPSTVINLGQDIFAGCSNLSNITLNWSAEQVSEIASSTKINENWLANTGSSRITINVPTGTVSTYQEYASQLGISNFTITDGESYSINASNVCTGENVSGDVVVKINGDNAYITSGNDLSGTNISFLSSISFNDSSYTLLGINENAFVSNSSINGYISLPNTITTLGENAFSNCANLNQIILNWNEEQIQTITSLGLINQNWLSNFDSSKLIITVPANLLSTYKQYLEQLGISNFTITDGQNYIVNASSVCSGDSVSGHAIISIEGTNVFILSGDDILGSNISLFSSISLNGSSYSVVGIGDLAFSSNYDISGSLYIPETISSIGDNAFDSCGNITSITINWNQDDFSGIGYNAFDNCTSLQSLQLPYLALIKFPKSNDFGIDITTINVFADDVDAGMIFSSYSNDLPSGECTVRKIDDNKYTLVDATNVSGSNLALDSTIVKIGDSAFVNNNNIEGSFLIHSSIESIGANAFDGCSAIQSFNYQIAPTAESTNIFDIVEDGAFANCTSLKAFTVKDLSSFTLDDLSRVGINKDQTYIVTQDDSTNYIDSSIGNIKVSIYGPHSNAEKFNIYDASLVNGKDIKIKDNVAGISDNAFANNSNITGSVTIPNTVTYIGNNAFNECNQIESIHLSWSADELDSISLDANWLGDLKDAVTLYVPANSYQAYVDKADQLGINPNEIKKEHNETGSKIAIGLSLGLALGIPAIGGITFGVVYFIKKKKTNNHGDEISEVNFNNSDSIDPTSSDYISYEETNYENTETSLNNDSNVNEDNESKETEDSQD